MAKKTCTCQQTPADPERRGVGDACLCEERETLTYWRKALPAAKRALCRAVSRILESKR